MWGNSPFPLAIISYPKGVEARFVKSGGSTRALSLFSGGLESLEANTASQERVAYTRTQAKRGTAMSTLSKPVAVREYSRIRNGKPQVVRSHQRRRRNWRRYV
jgi:hypothetical protein